MVSFLMQMTLVWAAIVTWTERASVELKKSFYCACLVLTVLVIGMSLLIHFAPYIAAVVAFGLVAAPLWLPSTDTPTV